MKKLFTFLVPIFFLFLTYQITAQTPVTPAHGSVNVPLLPTLTWANYMSYANATAGTYSILIFKKDDGLYNLVRSADLIDPMSRTYTVNPALNPNSEYEWFIKGSTEVVRHGNTGDLHGQGFVFTTLVPLPVDLSLPINGVTGVTIEPQFTWQAATISPFMYRFVLAKDADFTQIVYEKNTALQLSLSYNGVLQNTLPNLKLDYSTTYYWKVLSIYPDNSLPPADADGLLDELSSSVNHFTTMAEVPVQVNWPLNNSSVNLNTSVMFSWGLNQQVGTMKFKLQICRQTVAPIYNDWINQATTYPFQNTTTKSVSNLYQGTDYWWRVVLYNSVDQIIGYSANTFFTTEGGINVTATPSYPVFGETVYQVNPTLYWYIDQYASGITYSVWYCPDAGDVNINGRLDDEAGALNSGAYSSNLYKQLSGLSNGKTYYWQVEVHYAATGQSSFSAIETFNTEGPGTLLKPIASYPIDDVTVYTTSPYLYWYLGGSSAGLVYDLEYVVSTGAFTNSPSAGCNDIPELYKQISGLVPGVTYKWQVRTDNGATQSAWSDAGTFVVAGGAANTYPVATYPITDETVYTVTPTLYWYLEGTNLGVVNYTVKWYKGAGTPGGGWLAYAPGANDANGGSVTVPATDTYVQIPVNLTYGALYYWAVSVNNGIAPSAFSEGSFTIAGGASAGVAVLSQPANHEIVYGSDVNFGWFMPGGTFGVTNYTLTYSRSDIFASGVDAYGAITTSVATNNLFKLVNDLVPGATYYWYVTANYGDGTSALSLHQDFTIFTSSLAIQPRIGGPDNVTVPVVSPVLSWIVPLKTNKLYDLEVADNAGFNNKSVYTDINSTFKKVDGLEKGKNYFWRVQGKDNEGNTTYYSGTGKFTVDVNITSVEEQKIPNEYSLEQNYPNPFNPTTIIQFNMPRSGLASLKIFDILGREIATLMNEIKDAGTYKVTWNGSGLSSGIYIYKLTTGDFTSVKKMTLIK
ncbi:MAG: T9SS type A sorting domain-containing protein [Melioribacteraceae bacterium]